MSDAPGRGPAGVASLMMSLLSNVVLVINLKK
jgi:hypothetical protein